MKIFKKIQKFFIFSFLAKKIRQQSSRTGFGFSFRRAQEEGGGGEEKEERKVEDNVQLGRHSSVISFFLTPSTVKG